MKQSRRVIGLVMTVLSASLWAGSAPPVVCKLALDQLSVELSGPDTQLDIAVSQQGEVRTRMEVPVEGPLRACWVLDVNADGRMELLASTAAAEAGNAPMLRAWRWTGEWFESLAIAPLETDTPLPPTAVEDLRMVAGELVRSFNAQGSAGALANYRYDFEESRWISLKAMRPGVSGKPKRSMDDLLQAPTPKGAMP